jgi:hypothetical protein
MNDAATATNTHNTPKGIPSERDHLKAMYERLRQIARGPKPSNLRDYRKIEDEIVQMDEWYEWMLDNPDCSDDQDHRDQASLLADAFRDCASLLRQAAHRPGLYREALEEAIFETGFDPESVPGGETPETFSVGFRMVDDLSSILSARFITRHENGQKNILRGPRWLRLLLTERETADPWTRARSGRPTSVEVLNDTDPALADEDAFDTAYALWDPRDHESAYARLQDALLAASVLLADANTPV